MEKLGEFKVFNASAGSGKTFTLVMEYLKVVLSTSNQYVFQNILAITFTNKAAAEMKERVLGTLKDIAENRSNPIFDILLEEIDQSSEALQERAKRVYFAILNNYGGFSITTIDSFTSRIIRTFSHDLGLTSDFEVEMDTTKLIEMSVDQLFEKVGVDKPLTNLLLKFAKFKLDNNTSDNVAADIQDLASSVLLSENHSKHLWKLENKNIESFTKLQQTVYSKIDLINAELKKIGRQAIDLIDSIEVEYSDFPYGSIPNFFKKLTQNPSQAKFFDQSTLRVKIENDNFYKKSNSDEVKQKIDTISLELKSLYFESEELYASLLLYTLVSKKVVPLALLNEVQKELDHIKKENNIRLNAEFNQLIFNTIKDEPAPFIYERLGEKIKHYFIDEMQDTSIFQWKNLIKLIENSLSSDGGSLMLVGDAKQSIYRWRGGKAEQFIELSSPQGENPFSISKDVFQLETNYRSFSEVIGFNNSFFQNLSKLIHNDSYEFLYKNTVSQKENPLKGGFVSLTILKPTSEKQPLIFPEKVYQTIIAIRDSFSLDEICILVRNNNHGVEIADYLTDKNIPIVSSETLLLKNNLKIKFCIEFLKLIQNENDIESRSSVLCFIHQHFKIITPLHDFLSSALSLSTNQLFFEHLSMYGFSLRSTDIYMKSVYELIEYLLKTFSIAEIPDSYMIGFLEFTSSYLQKNSSSITNFLTNWESKKDKLSVDSAAAYSAVKIMTIHKSKGLEFPVVICPYNSDIYRTQSDWVNLKGNPDFDGFDSLLVSLNETSKYINDQVLDRYNVSRESNQFDTINTLYVALTRAKEQLYVITSTTKTAKDIKTTSDLFINYLKSVEGENSWDPEKEEYRFGNPNRVSKQTIKTDQDNTVELPEVVLSSWQEKKISIATNASILWGTDRYESVIFGNLIHEVLSKINQKEDLKEVIVAYQNQGVISKDESKEISRTLHLIFENSILKKYFDGSAKNSNETEIVLKDKTIIIPDRLVFFDTHKVAILDYKTGKSQRSYSQQISKYAIAMQDLGYTVEAKILIYIGQEISIEKVE